MLRVFLNPPPNPSIPVAGGIDRVVEALAEGLHEEDVVLAGSPDDADVIHNNGVLLEERPGVPMISSSHGLYWSDYEWPSWVSEANKRVTESMRRADLVTAPSEWVAHAISRGMLIAPEVVYHGVDTDAWRPPEGDHAGYVLWNKAREDSVSNPRDVQEAARRLSDIPFVSTFGIPTTNMRVIGPQDRRSMRELVRNAAVYLATTRETFGIGTIEALACGVPVVGWDYGGQREIIINGETGFLVPYGDYDRLTDTIRQTIADRGRLSGNARSDAEARWTWIDKVQRYAALYRRVVGERRMERPRVSIVVTTYNLAHFLPDCLASLREQDERDWEAIVVDDSSHDNPKQVIEEFGDGRVTYIRTRENVGLSTARNIGWMRSRGRYVVFLDADDMLDPSALVLLADALDHDTSIHIAYGGLDTVGEDGGGRRHNEWPKGEFDWRAQMSHLNQLPYAAMVRREVLERSGGYRERDWRAEDASMWCRMTSFGFRAKRVTERGLLIYRFRRDSKSAQESQMHQDRDGDWTKWFPWRTGASSGREGEELFYKGVRPNHKLVPFGAQGEPRPPYAFWTVHHFAHPCVSVIIPVSEQHRRYLTDALDSLVAQTVQSWEAIVIDDSPARSLPEHIPGHPYTWVLHSDGLGTSRARNIGLAAARGQFVLFLDADDVIEPTALQEMLEMYCSTAGYIYCDCKSPVEEKHLDGEMIVHESADYDQAFFIASGYNDDMPGRHSVTALIAKADLDQTPGFDETLAYWEDWAIYLELARLGVRGTRIARPLLTYRLHTGVRRKASRVQEGVLREALRERFEPYAKGAIEMCACGGGNGGDAAKNAALKALSMIIPDELKGEESIAALARNGTVRLQYTGDRVGAVPFRGRKTRRTYYAGRDPAAEFVEVDPDDAPELIRTGDFALVDTIRITERVDQMWAT